MQHFKCYSEQKDSGFEWIGQVPIHWQLEQAKHLFDKKARPIRDGDRVVTCFRDGTVTLREKRRLTGFTESIKEIGYQGICKGDLVIHAMDAFAGAVGVSDSDGKGSPVYSVCTAREEVSAAFYAYVVREMARSQWIQALAKGIRERSTDFRYKDFGNQHIPLPPYSEQLQVVKYLNYIDRRIQKYIRAKKKLIKLLEEQKQAVINQAVTKGLNPDVKMKPSGIEWLGEIPEHWEMRKLKFEVSFRGGGTPSKENPAYWNGSIPWVSPKDMKSCVVIDTEDHITQEAVLESSTNLVPAGSLLIVVRSGVLRRTIPVARCSREVALNQDMKALSSKGRLDLDYFALFIDGCENYLLQEWTKLGATVESIEHSYLANTKVTLPTIEEQTQLVMELSKLNKQQASDVDLLKKEINLLLEYRTRLISDAVTGKINVREIAAQLPDEEEDFDIPELDDALDEAIDEIENEVEEEE